MDWQKSCLCSDGLCDSCTHVQQVFDAAVRLAEEYEQYQNVGRANWLNPMWELQRRVRRWREGKLDLHP